MHRLLSASTLLLAAASARYLLGTNFGYPANATYDYVVVGGGTAGLTIASRLAAAPGTTVAVVEAGGFYELGNGNLSQIPAYAAFWAGKDVNDTNPNVDWGLQTVPQVMANNIPLHVTRGKTLGGSSARNYMVYQRGTASSYQMWADMVDDQSYTFDNLLPYFERSVNFTPPGDASKRLANATPEWDPKTLKASDSPLHVAFASYAQPFSTWGKLALEDLGFQLIDGFSSGKLIGVGWTPITVNPDTGERDSAETSFLRAALGNPNYRVYQSTTAKRILFESKRAVGVEVETAGAKYTLSAKNEVILSAGTFHSPQLLMVSGIGPAATLEKYNISVIADRPGVGQNMQDHVFFGPSYRVNVQTHSALGDPQVLLDAIDAFNNDQSGPLTSMGADIIGWEKLPQHLRANFTPEIQRALSTFPPDWPETEYIPTAAYFGTHANYIANNPPWNPSSNHNNHASMLAALVAPLSRGSVSIRSADAAVPPVIDPGWLSHPADQAVAVGAFRRVREIWAALERRGVTVGEEFFPGSGVQTDGEVVEWLKGAFATINHGVCTCRMGRRLGDGTAVVDAEARVIGVEGVRVVDAAAFALLPPGHPQATVYMLAEKIADVMLSSSRAEGSPGPRDEL